jgi:hypothetical protein
MPHSDARRSRSRRGRERSYSTTNSPYNCHERPSYISSSSTRSACAQDTHESMHRDHKCTRRHSLEATRLPLVQWLFPSQHQDIAKASATEFRSLQRVVFPLSTLKYLSIVRSSHGAERRTTEKVSGGALYKLQYLFSPVLQARSRVRLLRESLPESRETAQQP